MQRALRGLPTSYAHNTRQRRKGQRSDGASVTWRAARCRCRRRSCSPGTPGPARSSGSALPSIRWRSLERRGGLEPGARTVVRYRLGPLRGRWSGGAHRARAGTLLRRPPGGGALSLLGARPPDAARRRAAARCSRTRFATGFRWGPRARAVGASGAGAAGVALCLSPRRHGCRPRPARRAPRTAAAGGHHRLARPDRDDAWASSSTAGGHTVVPLGRAGAEAEVEGLDAVVNLAGAGIADGRWTAAPEAGAGPRAGCAPPRPWPGPSPARAGRRGSSSVARPSASTATGESRAARRVGRPGRRASSPS